MDIGFIFVRDLKLTSAKDPEDPQSLDKIYKGLLKIFEDPQRSWQEIWGSLKILKDLGKICKGSVKIFEDPQRSWQENVGSLKILKDLGKIHKGPLKIFSKNIEDP